MVEDKGKEFYERCLAKGLDYNFFGDWQGQYGKFVIAVSNVLPRVKKAEMSLLDVGTACGVNLRGIRNTGVFKNLTGVDASPYLINMGRQTHGFSEEEMMVANALELSKIYEPGSFDMIHCSQTMEHIAETDVPTVLKQFNTLLKPNGILMLVVDTVTAGQTEEALKEKDETHVTTRTRKWWQDQVAVVFKIDTEAHQRFIRTKFSPDNSNKTFFDYYKDQWGIIVGFKK